MRSFWTYFSLVIFTGCFTSGKNHKSEWIALDHAESIECSPWPKRPKDLRIETIKPIYDSKEKLHGFIVSVLTRSASRGQYFLPFQNSVELNLQKSQKIELPRGGISLGGTLFGKRTMIFTAQNTAKGVQLELRSVPDNVVRGKALLASESIDDGFISSTQGGFWLQYEDNNSEKVALIKTLPKDQIEIRRIPIAFDSKPILVSAPKGAFFVWRPDEPKALFKYRWVASLEGGGGIPGPVSTLPYRIQSQIESWTFGKNKEQYLLVAVDGDTLIGQAQLVVNSIKFGPTGATLATSHQLRIKDTHTTEPVIAPASQTSEILMLNWIDEESTIARYKLNDQGIAKPSHMGIFAKGTKIQWISKDPNEDNVYFLTKNKSDTEWNYSLCTY